LPALKHTPGNTHAHPHARTRREHTAALQALWVCRVGSVIAAIRSAKKLAATAASGTPRGKGAKSPKGKRGGAAEGGDSQVRGIAADRRPPASKPRLSLYSKIERPIYARGSWRHARGQGAKSPKGAKGKRGGAAEGGDPAVLVCGCHTWVNRALEVCQLRSRWT
jgi:hypothetical protein